MRNLLDELDSLVRALESSKIEYAVCRGLALAIHGLPRMTRDIDLLVGATDVEPVKEIGRSLGFDLPARTMTFGAGTPAERVVHRVSKADQTVKELVSIDLLEVGPAFEAIWRERIDVEWNGHSLCVVSREGLVAMKRISGRLQDLADIAKLEGGPDEEG